MKSRSSDDVIAGLGAWEPWHYIGYAIIPAQRITPNSITGITEQAARSYRELARRTSQAVIESTMAINRMMNRPDLDGAED